MTDNQQDPKTVTEEAGGYGTPTAEQEMPGGTNPAGAPDLGQSSAEDQDRAGEPGAGRFGGMEEQMSSENASAAPGFDADSRDAEVPSTDAELDASNTEEPDAGRPFSSESGQDAAGLPDGSGTDLPESKSPKDRDNDKDTFDAG